MNLMMRRLRRNLGSVLVLATVAACKPMADDALPGTLERDRIEVSADANEAIVNIAVREGQVVKRGDVLLVQDAEIANSQHARAAAQLAAAQAQLDELLHGPRATTVGAAVARRDRARLQRDNEVRERERLQSLLTQNLVSRTALDRQVAAAATADASLREAAAALRELQSGTRSEQVNQARRVVEQMRAQLQELETNSRRLEVRAPLDATVDALPYRAGEKPPRGATIAVLLSSGTPFARVHIPEPLRAKVHAGTTAHIKMDGVASEFTGHVRYVSSDAAFTPYFSLTESDRSHLSYLAEVLIDDATALALPSGLPLTVRLQLNATP